MSPSDVSLSPSNAPHPVSARRHMYGTHIHVSVSSSTAKDNQYTVYKIHTSLMRPSALLQRHKKASSVRKRKASPSRLAAATVCCAQAAAMRQSTSPQSAGVRSPLLPVPITPSFLLTPSASLTASPVPHRLPTTNRLTRSCPSHNSSGPPACPIPHSPHSPHSPPSRRLTRPPGHVRWAPAASRPPGPAAAA